MMSLVYQANQKLFGGQIHFLMTVNGMLNIQFHIHL